MFGIEKELSLFLQALLAGSTIFFAYDFLCVVRRLIAHRLFWISLEDFLFWIGTSVFLFLQVYRFNDGVIRWFFVIGVIQGCVCAYAIIGGVKRVYKKIKNLLIN